MTAGNAAQAYVAANAAFWQSGGDGSVALASQPDWLRQARTQALSRFETRGFPTRRDELWRYTSLDGVTSGEPFVAVAAAPTGSLAMPQKEDIAAVALPVDGPCLVFVDGCFAPKLSTTQDLPASVVAQSLEAALASPEHQPLARRLWEQAGQWADQETAPQGPSAMADDMAAAKAAGQPMFSGSADVPSSLVALNGAFARDGFVLHVPRGVQVEKPVHVVFWSTGAQARAATYPRVLVDVEAGAQLALVETYVAQHAGAYLTNTVAHVQLGADAQVKHLRMQQEGRGAQHLAEVRVVQARGSHYNQHSFAFGGALSRQRVSVQLAGEGAECQLDGLYVGGDRQHLDTHTHIEHAVPNCNSRELYRGVLAGRATSVFGGHVVVQPGADGTDATQANHNLLLSRQAVANTKPQLEIYADDVKCAHGATVGQLDDSQWFYLQSRGISPSEAQMMLTRAFAQAVVERMPWPQLASAVEGMLDAQLTRVATAAATTRGGGR